MCVLAFYDSVEALEHGHVGLSLGDTDGDGKTEIIHAYTEETGVIISDDYNNIGGCTYIGWSWPPIKIIYANKEYLIKAKAPSENGDHTVWVQVVTNMGSADDIKSFSVFEPFTFVHITDVHMGWSEEIFILWPISVTITSKRILSAAIDKINEINPDFILDTGDIAEKGSMQDAYWAYRDALDSLNDIKIYTVSGNHDWYTFWYGIGNLKNYEDIIIPTRPSGCDPLISPDDHNNYYFEHKSYLFVGLDTGWDVGGPLFQGSGLSNKQIEGLNNLKSELKEKRKIIFMHHPAINGQWPTAGHWCIKYNRLNFIDYCVNNEVSLVLTGHTHEDKVFNIVGEREYWNLWGSTLWPLFVQTPSLSKEENIHGYRKITIRCESIEQKMEWLGTYPSFFFSVASPVTLHAYDSQGLHTGINFSTGAAERNIPRSFYFSNYTFEAINEVNETVNVSVPATIMLYNVSQDYSIKIVANLTEEQKASPATEHFNFTVERQTAKGSRTLLFYDNISLFENTTAILPFNLTTTNYTMEIDYNGNGTIDEKKSPDATKIDYAPKAEIISPVNNSTYLFGVIAQ